MTRIFHRLFLWKWIPCLPCQAVTSVLCLHYRPETVHCSTKDAYTSEITFLALKPCILVYRAQTTQTAYLSFHLTFQILRQNIFYSLKLSTYILKFENIKVRNRRKKWKWFIIFFEYTGCYNYIKLLYLVIYLT